MTIEEIEALKLTDYVRKAAADNNYWLDFSRNKIKKYKSKFGKNFRLIIYSEPDSDKDYYIIPFAAVEDLFQDKLLSNDNRNENSRRWVMTIKNHVIQVYDTKENIEDYYAVFLKNQKVGHNQVALNNKESIRKYIEGTAIQVIQTKYERNPRARKVCLEHYGYKCSVCDFDFQKIYGELGTNFIHVHHLTQVSTIGKTYQINPINDLRPVCPNCHAMLHRQNPPLEIQDLKNIILIRK